MASLLDMSRTEFARILAALMLAAVQDKEDNSHTCTTPPSSNTLALHEPKTGRSGVKRSRPRMQAGMKKRPRVSSHKQLCEGVKCTEGGRGCLSPPHNGADTDSDSEACPAPECTLFVRSDDGDDVTVDAYPQLLPCQLQFDRVVATDSIPQGAPVGVAAEAAARFAAGRGSMRMHTPRATNVPWLALGDTHLCPPPPTHPFVFRLYMALLWVDCVTGGERCLAAPWYTEMRARARGCCGRAPPAVTAVIASTRTQRAVLAWTPCGCGVAFAPQDTRLAALLDWLGVAVSVADFQTQLVTLGFQVVTVHDGTAYVDNGAVAAHPAFRRAYTLSPPIVAVAAVRALARVLPPPRKRNQTTPATQ